MTQPTAKPFLGFGLGLRAEHYQDILERQPKNIDWFEILSENYMIDGGKPLYFLDAIRQDYPMVMHGVSMSLGSTDELDFEYLKQLKKLVERVEPRWFSDHLCWTGVDGRNLHDLMPLPYTEEALALLVERVGIVQDFMEAPLVLVSRARYHDRTSSPMRRGARLLTMNPMAWARNSVGRSIETLKSRTKCNKGSCREDLLRSKATAFTTTTSRPIPWAVTFLTISNCAMVESLSSSRTWSDMESLPL